MKNDAGKTNPPKVRKIEAATGQLATAIRLYFDGDDPISIHTLSMAAGQIFDRLCATRGLESLRQMMLARVIPERRKEVVTAMNKAANFFKHSCKGDPNEELELFSDDNNFWTILQAAYACHLLGVSSPETRVFLTWVGVVEPDLLHIPYPKEQTMSFGEIANEPRHRQKQLARDALHLMLTGKLPNDVGIVGNTRHLPAHR